jgi:lipid-A-disaccharide synthase
MQPIYTGCIANPSNPKIFLSAGEASGDHYGAQLIAELRNRHPGATFFGLGGREMEAADQDRIIRAEDVAHMGITEVLRHAPRVYGSYRRLVASIRQRRPNIAILIDFPDVNFRLARELKALNIPVVYFVSPQLWAWKRRRLRWVQHRVDRMMVIFPFEERFYKARGVDAKFVGHPLAQLLQQPAVSREAYAAAHDLDLRKTWIALLPGSRWKEIRSNLDPMLDLATWSAMADDSYLFEFSGSIDRSSGSFREFGAYEFLMPVASTISEPKLQLLIDQMNKGWLNHGKVNASDLRLHLVPDAREALHHARASVVASGTATVQAAVIGNPFIVVYKVSPLTFRLAKRLVHYPPEVWPSGPDSDGNLPIGMVNLIAGRRIVPELLQDRFTAANVASALRPLLSDTPERAQMIADLAQVRQSLQPQPGTGSIQQVCDAVDDLLVKNQSVSGPKSPAHV